MGIDKAMKGIADYQKMLSNSLSQEDSLKRGLEVFKIDHNPSKDIETVTVLS